MKKCVYFLFSLIFLTLLVAACDDVTTITTKDGYGSSDTSSSGYTGSTGGTTGATSIYTVTLDSAGGTLASYYDSILKRKAGSTLEDSVTGSNTGIYSDYQIPTRTGYGFTGWYDNRDSGGTKYYSKTVITKDVTLYARWAQLYSVTLDPQNGVSTISHLTRHGGSTLDDNYSDGNVGSYTNVAKPTRTGYSFVGWYDTSATTGGTLYTVFSVITHNVILYARWAPIFTVTLNPSPATLMYGYDSQLKRVQGALLSDDSGDNSGHFSENYIPTRTNYGFIGWYDDPTAGTRYYGNAVINNNLTLYAHWVLMYTVILDPNQGKISSLLYTDIKRAAGHRLGDNTFEATVGTFNSYIVPTRIGFTFLGWYDAVTGGTKYDETSIINNDITLYAHWLP